MNELIAYLMGWKKTASRWAAPLEKPIPPKTPKQIAAERAKAAEVKLLREKRAREKAAMEKGPPQGGQLPAAKAAGPSVKATLKRRKSWFQ